MISKLKTDVFLFVLFINFINCTNAESTEPATGKQESLNFDYKLSKKLPQAIIIGAKKCGTRALLKFISAHPNVSAAGAEVHFFDRFYHMGLDWYRDQMPISNQNQITIEKTPKYLIDPKVPERVFKMNPKTKLIVVVRNPVTRAVSEYVQGQWRKKRHIQAYNESKRFEKMLYQNHRIIREDWPIIRNGIYYHHIKKWLEYFPIENFVFINGGNLIREPHVEIEKLQSFLNLKPIIKKEHFVLTDKKKGFACIIKPLDSKQIRCLSDQKGRKHPEIDQSILNDLQDFYRPYDRQLFELTKQKKPFWSS